MERRDDGHSPVVEPSTSVRMQEPAAGRASGAAVSAASSGSAVNGAAPLPSFAQVYEQQFDFVWRSARRLGVPEANVDDVVQDVFLTVYRRLPDFEGRSQLKTWIFGILRHTISDMRRSLRRKPTAALEQEPVDGSSVSPHEAAARSEGWLLLHEALAALTDEQREVFVLAELEQLSSPEIASALEVNLNTVYSRLRAARQEFEAALKRLRTRDEWRTR